MPEKAVDEEEVNKQVNEIVNRIPCYADVTDQAVAADDKAKVRLTMRENGAVMGGLDGLEMTMSLGDGFFPKALTDGMVGMMPGETRHIEWSGAGLGAQEEDDSSSSFDADVEVISVRKRVKPDMTDEWVAAHIPRCSTLEEFFADVRKQLQDKSDETWNATLRDRSAIVLAQRLTEMPPQIIVDRAIEGVKSDFELGCAREGKIRSEKAAELGLDEAQLDEMLEQQGRLVAAQGEAVRLMALHLGIEPDQNDLDRALKSAYPEEADAKRFLDQPGSHEKLVELARYELALDFVTENAKIVDEEEAPEPLHPEGEIPGTPYPNPFA